MFQIIMIHSNEIFEQKKFCSPTVKKEILIYFSGPSKNLNEMFEIFFFEMFEFKKAIKS